MNAQTSPSIAAEQANDLAYDLVRLLKLLRLLRDRAPRVVHGLDPASQPILHRLANCTGTRVTDLACALHADVSTISRQASGLVQAGLVEKTTDPGDRRVQVLALTEAGRAAIAALHEQRAEAFARILHDWTPDEVTAFRAFIDRFTGDLQAELGLDQAAARASLPHEITPHDTRSSV